MKSEHKMFAAIGVLAGLIGVYAWSSSSSKAEKDSHSQSAQKADLPAISVAAENTDKITKLEFKNGDKPAVVLEKGAAGWEITAPIKAKASATDVKTLLDGLKNLKVTDAIDRGTGTYDQYEVADGKGLRFTAYSGGEKTVDAIFGQSGTRGQTLRVIGRDGVWVGDGYTASNFNKEAKNWRDKSILKFEDTNVASVDIENESGKYVFVKNGDNWTGSFEKNKNPKKKVEDAEKPEGDKKADDKKPEDKKTDGDKKPEGDKKADDKKPEDKKTDGDKKVEKKADGEKKKADGEKKADEKKAEPEKADDGKGWAKFDGKTVENMLRSLKALNATDFADDGAKDADTGLDDAVGNGGVITIHFKDGSEVKLLVGKKQKGTSRFAKKSDDGTVFVISSYSADWIMAEPKKFEKKDDKKDPKAPPDDHGDDDMDLEIPGMDE